jgi:thymidylate synthase (FAD)
MSSIKNGYHQLLDMGVGKEQARAILPLNQYTEVYWTASFQAVMNFIELRNEKTSQWEIQEYAKVMLEQMKEVFPKTTKIWSEVNGWL